MDLFTLFLIGLVILALGGWGYGTYAGGPGGGAPAPIVSGLGLVALILIVALIAMLITGWRFDQGMPSTL
jgi:hypothetical protein